MKPTVSSTMKKLFLLPLLFQCCLFETHLPRDFYIDDKFSEKQITSIINATKRWNELGHKCFGYDILIFKGTIHSDHPFEPRTDLYYDKNIIWLGVDNFDYEILNAWFKFPTEHSVYDFENEGKLKGYTFSNQIVLYPFAYNKDISYIGSEQSYLDFKFEKTAEHEEGHFLGIISHVIGSHIAIMGDAYYERDDLTLSSEDIDIFVKNNGCPNQH